MVTKFVPVPDDSGGKQRSLAILRRLAARFDVTLCAYDDGTADRAPLEKLGVEVRAVPWRPSPARAARGVARTRSISAGRFWSAPLRREVQAAAADGPLDLLQVEYVQMAPLVRGVAARRRVLDLHNVESALAASYAAGRRFPRSAPFQAEAFALRHIERSSLRSFDTVVVVSSRERDRLPTPAGSVPAGSVPAGSVPVASVLVCRNGIETADPLPEATSSTVVFVATMGWPPNTEAALWLGRDIWPAVRKQVPGAALLLVGRDPPPAVRALAGSDVEVTGAVADVRPYLARARVAVAPLRAGGGTRLKLLEALGGGRPVVATSVGVDGLEDLVGRGVVVADGAEDIAGALVELLKHPGRAADMGRVGARAVAAEHSWDGALAPLLEAVST